MTCKILLIGFCFFCNLAFCQNEVAVDTIKSNISVRYGRVEFSNGWACEAELQVSFAVQSKNVVLFFEVPNYDVRYKTTEADYAIIKLKDKEIRLQNLVEFDANGLIQKFVFALSKDSLLELLDVGLKEITFYFAPNEDFINKRLATEKNLNPKYREVISQDAKKTVSTTIWRPDKKKLNEMNLWLQNL